MENLDELLRFRRLDRNNCNEEAMVKLMTVAANRIAELERQVMMLGDRADTCVFNILGRRCSFCQCSRVISL